MYVIYIAGTIILGILTGVLILAPNQAYYFKPLFLMQPGCVQDSYLQFAMAIIVPEILSFMVFYSPSNGI
jgi:hypothetical protein